MRQETLAPVARISSIIPSRAVLAPFVKTTTSSKPRRAHSPTTSRKIGWSVGSPPRSVIFVWPAARAARIEASTGSISAAPAWPRAVRCPLTQKTQRLLQTWPSWISTWREGSLTEPRA